MWTDKQEEKQIYIHYISQYRQDRKKTKLIAFLTFTFKIEKTSKSSSKFWIYFAKLKYNFQSDIDKMLI